MDYFLLLLGAVAGASAVVMIKACDAHPFVVAFGRLFFAVLLLVPFFMAELRKTGFVFLSRHFGKVLLPGVALGIHFLFWISGARLTGTANSTLIVNLVPVLMPFLLAVSAKEIVNSREILGTVISLAGLFLLTRSDFHISGATLQGDVFCLVSMVFLAVYLVLAKTNLKSMPLWLYIVPVYLIAGVFCLIASFFVTHPFAAWSSRDWLWIPGLAVVPTVIGHTVNNHLMRRLRGQVVSLAGLSQFLFAGLMGWMFLGEKPTRAFYPAGLLVLAGAVISVASIRKLSGNTGRI